MKRRSAADLLDGEDLRDERATFSDNCMKYLPGAYLVEETASDAEDRGRDAKARAASTLANVASGSASPRMMSKAVGRRTAVWDTPHPRLYLETHTDDDESGDSLPPSFFYGSDAP
eukprot:TRINITY_DN66600_c0_g1_i1.p3 TRINITY_DN66600_c0_g1~~TRINITY_DN66600_c0_g1_i1.p3  ORF type:complete len:116 (+),score=18.67 TRINITY_DN66600_c0_g1_i1:373-720(+)